MIPDLIKSNFEECYDFALKDPLLFGDYLTANPADPDIIDPRLYQDCGDYDNVKKKF